MPALGSFVHALRTLTRLHCKSGRRGSLHRTAVSVCAREIARTAVIARATAFTAKRVGWAHVADFTAQEKRKGTDERRQKKKKKQSPEMMTLMLITRGLRERVYHILLRIDCACALIFTVRGIYGDNCQAFKAAVYIHLDVSSAQKRGRRSDRQMEDACTF